MTLHLLQMEQDCGKRQNAWSHACSQRSVEEYLQETTIGDGDTHLVEFSDAMRSMNNYPSLVKFLCPTGPPSICNRRCTENLPACN